ncbi:C-X-C chemokine receptor type 5 [Pempheris klunzingeri]|uniref:C-X-C chemokine receptor type 5 n=1 Tax=Pempheris klunzingeri TaxID=3127111 RepID=UPI00397F7126
MAVTLTFTTAELDYSGDQNGTDYSYDIYDNEPKPCDNEEVGLQTFHGVFRSVLYCFILLLGVVGNGLMITVLLRRWRLLRITEIYLLHLALADLMLLSTLPFDFNDVTGWIFGVFLCKLVGLVKNINLLCVSLLLACIGFDRYLAIVHAIPSMQNRRRRTVHLTCTTLWLICLGLSIPTTVFLTVGGNTTNSSMLFCSYNDYGIHANNWVLALRVFDHVSFFLPLAVMSYCYTAVVITLCKSRKSQAKQGAIRLASLVTLVFCFCWLPYNITLLIKTMTDLKVIEYQSCESYDLLIPALDMTKTLGLSHCCLNPFLYAFLGVKFRNELLQLLCKLGCGRVCMPFIRTQGHSRPSISDGATTTSNLLL